MASNGQLPSDELAELSTPGRLIITAAASFELLRIRADTEGTDASNEAYRTYAEQEDIFTDRYQTAYCEYAPGRVDARTWNGETWYRKPGEAAAAVPGTSNHGWGKAVDWQGLGGYGSSSWERFADLAPEYGWDNREGASIDEPWHWVYNQNNDQHLGEGTGVELDETVKLTESMQNMSDWGKTEVTVGGLLGYLASSAWNAGVQLDNQGARFQRIEETLDELLTINRAMLDNQNALREALSDLTVNVDLELHPVLGPLVVEMAGTVTQPDAPEPPTER